MLSFVRDEMVLASLGVALELAGVIMIGYGVVKTSEWVTRGLILWVCAGLTMLRAQTREPNRS